VWTHVLWQGKKWELMCSDRVRRVNSCALTGLEGWTHVLWQGWKVWTSHCQRTWVHTSYSVPAHKFTLLTLLEHMSSHFLPCQNRWVHTSHPVRAHEFTPGFKWGSCYSVISFQCNVLYIVVCTFSFGHCVVCPSLIYGYWLLLWYVQALRYSVYTKKNLR
jgi:hypothetical protein